MQSPRLSLVPPASGGNDAADAVFLAASYGLTADEWQEAVLQGWLSLRLDGKWAAPRCGLACPRQNGKNGIVEIRELHGLVVLGEKWLHTAHEVKTARKAFQRLLHFFDNEKFPELQALVKDIRRTNGQEAIILHNGGSVEFVARSRGSGRGFTVDVLLLDEAQELSEEALEALMPTISAAPLGNPQMILTGTPPGPKSIGEAFTRIRTAGVAGKDRRLCWHEWSAADGARRLDDRRAWAEANPALGIRLNVETIADERATFDDAGFARERLGVWDDAENAGKLFPGGEWQACLSPESTIDGDPLLLVDVSPTHTHSCIVAGGLNEAGRVHVEVTGNDAEFDHRPGTGWVVKRVVDIVDRTGALVHIFAGSAAASLVPELEAEGVDVETIPAAEMTAACGAFIHAVREGKVAHLGQDALDAAVEVAKVRDVGDGAFAFARRKSDGDITALYAATGAAWLVAKDADYAIDDSFK